MVSKSQIKATQNYVKNKYDRHVLTMPKGKKERIKAAAVAAGESVNAFINNAIDMRMASGAAGDPAGAGAGPGDPEN